MTTTVVALLLKLASSRSSSQSRLNHLSKSPVVVSMGSSPQAHKFKKFKGEVMPLSLVSLLTWRMGLFLDWGYS